VAWYREALDLMGAQGDARVLIDALEGTALAAVAWDQPERAARLLGAAEALGERYAIVAFVVTDRTAHERVLAAAREALGASRFETAWAAGRRLTVAEAVAEVGGVADPGAESASAAGGLRLSSRERDVLRLVAAGATDREIAEALFLSVRTVEAHVARIRAKIGVHTRTAAVAAGLIDPVTPNQGVAGSVLP
jgi:DNA-binding CsgD family transcriptional regulator